MVRLFSLSLFLSSYFDVLFIFVFLAVSTFFASVSFAVVGVSVSFDTYEGIKNQFPFVGTEAGAYVVNEPSHCRYSFLVIIMIRKLWRSHYRLPKTSLRLF